VKSFHKWRASCLGQIFLAAAFLRLLLAPFFFHTDIKTNYYNSHFLSQGVFNIYDFLAKNPDQAVLGEFSYPPLTYWFYGLVFFPLKLLLGNGFAQWLAMGNEAVTVPNLFRFLFFMKLPLFVFEFLTGWLLIKMVKGERQKERVLLFWLFNPVNLYAIVLMGQFDVVPTFLVVLALFLALEKKHSKAAISLGLGAAFKTFPLLFLPFLALSVKDWKNRLKIFGVGLLPYLASILPFIRSKAFWQSSLVSGLSQRIFFLGLEIGFEEKILLVVLALVGLLFVLDWQENHSGKLAGYFLALPLIILAGSHFHPQWLLWATPFLALFLSKENKLVFPIIILLAGWLGKIILFNDKFLTLGLISPFDPGVFFLPSFRDLVKDQSLTNLAISLLQTLFTASAIWLSFLAAFKVDVKD